MDCIFCKIAQGKAQAYKVYEDNEVVAFLDIFPASKGQMLVIPKKHYEKYMFDIPEDLYLKLMKISRKIIKAIDKAFGTSRTCLLIEGLDVPHVHVKLYPLYNHGLKLSPMKNRPTDSEFVEIANKIKGELK